MPNETPDYYQLATLVMDICMELDAKREQITVEKIEKALSSKGETLDREYIEYILKERRVELVIVDQKDGRVAIAWRQGANSNVNVIDEWTNLELHYAMSIGTSIMNGGIPDYMRKPSHELHYPRQKEDRAVPREMLARYDAAQGNRSQRRARRKTDD